MTRSLRKVMQDADRSGHRLWLAREGDDVLLWCSLCHGYCTSSARHLGGTCDPLMAKAGHGPTSGRRFRAGLHPQTRRPLVDVEPLSVEKALWLAGRYEVPRLGESVSPVVTVNGSEPPSKLEGLGDPAGSTDDNAGNDEAEFDFALCQLREAEVENDIFEDVFGHGYGFD